MEVNILGDCNDHYRRRVATTEKFRFSRFIASLRDALLE
jgi:hypothetical protein